MPARPTDSDLKTAAAQCQGDGRLRACSVENDMGGNPRGQFGIGIKVPHSAQISLALLAHIANEDQRSWKLYLAQNQSASDGHHADDASAVVAGSGGFQPGGIQTGFVRVLAAYNRVERSSSREDGVQVCRKNDNRPGAFGRQAFSRKDAEDIAHLIG